MTRTRTPLLVVLTLLLLGAATGTALADILPAVVPQGARISLALPDEVIDHLERYPSVNTRITIGNEIQDIALTLETALAATWNETGSVKTTIQFVAENGLMVASETTTVRVVYGPLTLLPPAVAIIAAIVLRQVILSLFLGILTGALLLQPSLFGAVGNTLRRIVEALTDADRASILIFTMLLGGMVGIISRNGGTLGIVELLASKTTSRRGVQLSTWALGLVIFFDDYANSLLVGTTMRPLTDRAKISREKLAFLVDSTAAPVASVALFSTWIGFELDQIQSATGLDTAETYGIFIESLGYRFYPFLVLAFILMMVISRRDFGPMLAAERRTIETGEALRNGSTPASDFAHETLSPAADGPAKWIDAALPIATVVFATCAGLVKTGFDSIAGGGGHATLGTLFQAEGTSGALRMLLHNANSYDALLWGSFYGCVVAAVVSLLRRSLRLAEVTEAWFGGVRSMMMALIILVLAAGIGTVCKDLFVPEYTVALLGDTLPSSLLPAAVFIVACLASFATGSSWTTIGILTPLVAPLATALAGRTGVDPHDALVAAIGSILAGAIFGDHCSPISDTTILSSLASSCDHVDHVKTQAPIAIVVGTVSIVIGCLGTAAGLPLWSVWILALGALAGWLYLFGKNPEEVAIK